MYTYKNTHLCTLNSCVYISMGCMLGTHRSPYPNLHPQLPKHYLLLGHRANQAKSLCLPGWWWSIVRTSRHTESPEPCMRFLRCTTFWVKMVKSIMILFVIGSLQITIRCSSPTSFVAFHNSTTANQLHPKFRRLVPQHLRKFRVKLPFLSSTCRLQSFLESFKRPNQICGFHVQICGFHVKHDTFLQLIWPILRFHEPVRTHLVPFLVGALRATARNMSQGARGLKHPTTTRNGGVESYGKDVKQLETNLEIHITHDCVLNVEFDS